MTGENDSYKFTEHLRLSLKTEAKRILSFLDARKIVITGAYEYEDFREDADKVELHSLDKMYVMQRRSIFGSIIERLVLKRDRISDHKTGEQYCVCPRGRSTLTK